jgi:hypothetical protein
MYKLKPTIILIKKKISALLDLLWLETIGICRLWIKTMQEKWESKRLDINSTKFRSLGMGVLFEDWDMSDDWGTVEAAPSKSIKPLELLMPASTSFQQIIDSFTSIGINYDIVVVFIFYMIIKKNYFFFILNFICNCILNFSFIKIKILCFSFV